MFTDDSYSTFNFRTLKTYKMKNEDKSNSPRVRVVVLGNMNVGKSGKF